MVETETVFAGLPAADGLVLGVLHVRRETGIGRHDVGDPAAETAALKRALSQAQAELAALMAAHGGLAQDILEFQYELLEDDALLRPAFATVAAGEAADAAWAGLMDREIAEYRDGGDETMAARADDLLDLKRRVLAVLADPDPGPGEGPDTGASPVPDGAVLVADDLTPSAFLGLDWARMRGAAIRGGSPTSHVAILARAHNVPLVVGLQADPATLVPGTRALLDAEFGRLVLAPTPETLDAVAHRLSARGRTARAAAAVADEPAVTADGDVVTVLINVDDPAGLADVAATSCDGIGLTRTEFLFDAGPLPDEAAQYAVYARLVAWAEGRPVTIRTLDAGGDKPIPGVTPTDESNPFLGLRGLRLSFARPALFTVQLRALLRAAALGPVKIMAPMVTVPAEMVRLRSLVVQVGADLAAAGIAHGRPALGMMVEVPAAALMAEAFDADFYSIGSNDLIQYTTAVARDTPSVAALADPHSPAVRELIARTVTAGARRGVEVSLCGDMAADPALTGALLSTGLRTFSVAPSRLGPVKLAIRHWSKHHGAVGR